MGGNLNETESTMKHQKLTEAEERRLGEAIAAEARALGFVGKGVLCRNRRNFRHSELVDF